MNILYISQYFPPEIGATQVRAKENVLMLQKLGFSVTVLTELPNHPMGIIHENYRKKLVVREKWRGINILRVWVFTTPVKNFLSRILFYLSFMMMGIICGILLLRKKFHIVYATSPPFFVGLVGLFLSRLRGGKLVFEVRDLWPRSAIELGELHNKTIIKYSEKLENYYYKKAALTVAVTRGIYKNIIEKIGNQKVLFIPNGANIDLYRPDYPIPKDIRKRYENKFVVSYTGVIGLIHGVEVVIDTALLLKDIPDIFFIIIGDGVKKHEMIVRAGKYNLKNVEFISALRESELVPYIIISQVALATAKKMPITRGTLPVKMFSSLACAVPVVLSVVGEGAELLESANAGLVVEPDNPKDMAEAILNLYHDRVLAKKLGENGCRFVTENYNRKKLAEKLSKKLVEISSYV